MTRGRKYLSTSYGEGKELEEQRKSAELFTQAADELAPAPAGPPRVDAQPLNRPTERPFEPVTANNLNQFGNDMQMDRNFILRQMYAVLPSPDILALMDDGF
jgi:hypothetical protein|tara:strand:+ start:600 stop:905 length:306 start_codon:yes stop_codon:yes gene_type:complete